MPGNDCDGSKDRGDYGCIGLQNTNTGVICRQSDSNCPGYDPTTHTKYVCECPDSSKCSITGSSYTCKPKGKCSTNSDCDSGWCCDDKTPTYQCVYKGTILSSGGKSYLCDPPEGFVNSNENINTNTRTNKKSTLLDLLINPFSYFFKK